MMEKLLMLIAIFRRARTDDRYHADCVSISQSNVESHCSHPCAVFIGLAL
jgi:hypothetical protein